MSRLAALISHKDLRQKIFFTLFLLLIYRLGSHIPISGIDVNSLQALFSKGGVLGFFNLFSGGNLSRFSLFGLGILPYINASIIMQLASIVWPKLKEIAEEGESGRKQLAQYTRFLAIGIALVQSVVMAVGFRAFLLPDVSFSFFLFYAAISLVAGSALVMWFGELVTEYGIGNGASILIFVGIVAQMPYYIHNTYVLVVGGASLFSVLFLLLVFMLMIVAIVYVQEAQRKIPVQYAKRVVGRKVFAGSNTFIPLKLIQGGVMPIIFASALLQFPLIFAQYFELQFIKDLFHYDGIAYNAFFCLMIFFFTYFYTAITFNPQELSDNIKKYGGFIMGVRPGKSTVDFLDGIVSKLTLVGATFLALLALLPVIFANITKVTSFMGLGGTALLIIVGVALDLIKQIDSFIITKKYEGYL
jgi:preprotein translocase subunit SecY